MHSFLNEMEATLVALFIIIMTVLHLGRVVVSEVVEVLNRLRGG